MALPNELTNLFLSGAGEESYEIARSLRFNSADSAKLNRTWGATGSRTTWTLSMWLKRASIGTGTAQAIFHAGGASSLAYDYMAFDVNDSIDLVMGDGADGVNVRKTTTQKFRDVSAWFHFVWVWDSTNGTAEDRSRFYINGVRLTSFSLSTNPGASYNPGWYNVNAQGHWLLSSFGTAQYFNGYLADVHFVNAQALSPSSFGETDSVTGAWKAKEVTGLTYGTNGFWLSFADNTSTTTLGRDDAGGLAGAGAGSNDWTLTNLATTDSMTDTPTNNYCVLNVLDKNSTITLSDGNLKAEGTADKNVRSSFILPTTGKWYWEAQVIAGGAGASTCGVMTPQTAITNNAGFRGYQSDGLKFDGTGTSAYGATYTTTSVIGIAWDAVAGSITFYKANVSQGVAFTGLTGEWCPAFRQINDTSPPWVANFGQGGLTGLTYDAASGGTFKYTPPADHKALCTANFSVPTIKKPSSYFEAKTYTGTGSSLAAATGMNFQPDLVWIKGRSGATSHALYDSVRGVQKNIAVDTTVDEATADAGLTAFGANGFTVNTLAKVNTSSATYVGWCWKMGTTPGFDIVNYIGDGANRTIAHSLGVVPKLMIVKARTTASTDQPTAVYSSTLAATQFLILDTTAAVATGATYWNSTTPTSSVFSLGTHVTVNALNDTYIAYLFSEVLGFSKIGTFIGNAAADGPFVWCGFKPRWIMIKCTSTTGSWYIWDGVRDPLNPADGELLGDTAAAEAATADLDFLSSGFKIRATTAGYNASGATFMFVAFAESPFKYALAS